jgi:chemotaxis protein methyltransferase CheR
MMIARPLPPLAGPTPTEFAAIARIAAEDAGIFIAPGKTSMVQSRLLSRLRVLGMADYTAYLALIGSDAGHGERRAMISALTTNVTQFFREAHHFEAFATHILPGLIAHARRGGRVRIWSAGCSTGQEPLSIAMTILSQAADAAKMDIRVLATDIDEVVIAHARAGRYDAAALSAIPGEHRARFVTDAQDGPQLTDGPAQIVRFHQLNLHAAWPMTRSFDAIFCRNVAIYFTVETQAALWPRFASVLAPRGWLFVGHSERVPSGADSHFMGCGITTYRLRGGVPGTPGEQQWR